VRAADLLVKPITDLNGWLPESRTPDPKLQAELEVIANEPIADLRKRYVQVFRTAPPKAFGPDLLRRSIAYRLKEQTYGGLPNETKRLLDKLVQAYLKNPTGRIELPRRIKQGSVLVRTWNNKVYQVMVQDNGFAYEGKTFSSLSEIAFQITGTKWNGPRFFGLRPKAKEADAGSEASKRARQRSLADGH
jgi:hypothetical protein